MLAQFYTDLEKAKAAEDIVRETLNSLTTEYMFIDVSNDKECYYKGDILAFSSSSGQELYIEVKNDSRIWETRNVLCEEEVYYKSGDYYGKGNMSCHSDILAVVSQAEQKIYFIDFHILKENYRKGEYKIIDHPQQTTYCYLCGLSKIKQWGALISVVNYAQEI